MLRILIAAVVIDLAALGWANAADLVYVARLDGAGAVVEERTLRCEPQAGCILAFDEASDSWRQALSLEIKAEPTGLELTGRSAGPDDQPMLVARRSLSFGTKGGMVTVRLMPEVPVAHRFKVGGDVARDGFGPFLVGLQPLQP
jgi:hypothetical protein